MGTAAEKSLRTRPAAKASQESINEDLLDSQLITRSSSCSNCNLETRCRRRAFSEQAWTVLLLWNEINPNAVDQAICEDCYQEMREILIDRNGEIEDAMQQSDEVARIKKRLGNIAS